MNKNSGLINEIKKSFRDGGALIRLIYINIAVFLVINIIALFLFLFNLKGFGLVNWLAVPEDLSDLATKPWTLLTYMFTHEGFFHILFNMLWLYWLGKIFVYYIDTKRLLNVYFLGGFAGAALYILAFNTLPVFENTYSRALGASASVMAVIIAICTFQPDFKINMLFFGAVPLKYIGLISVGLDIVMIKDGNAGGHIAHLGGALFGFIFALQYKKGKDITKGFGKIMDKIFSLFASRSKRKIKVVHRNTQQAKNMNDMEYNVNKHSEQEEMDRILDKIAKNGYNSLNKIEKETLFRISKK